MEHWEKNRKVASIIGDITTALYGEMENLPLSEPAKHAMLMIMLGDLVKRDGRTVNFYLPLQLMKAVSS